MRKIKKSLMMGALLLGMIFFALPSLRTYAADGIAVDEDAFPDEIFRSYISEVIDTDGNGFLSDEECEAVTVMDIPDMDIDDLDGLGYFTNLEALDCSNNNLYSLDLRECRKLRRLECQNNGLWSLDLSGNELLSYLDCGNNELVTLDLSHNSMCFSIYCAFNHISLLDLRNIDFDGAGQWALNKSQNTIVIKYDYELGWVRTDHGMYYVVDDGTEPKTSHLATGSYVINGREYQFDEFGVLQTEIEIPTEIVVQPASVSMTVWDELTLQVKTDPENISEEELIWNSEDEDIVTVDEHGVLTPVSVGTTMVTVSSLYDTSVMYVVPVTVKPLISVGSNEIELLAGDEKDLEIVWNTDRINLLEWEVEDPEVVQMSSDYKATARGEGETDILFTVTDPNGRSEEFIIHVTVTTLDSLDTDVRSIELYYDWEQVEEGDEFNVYEGGFMDLDAVVYTTDGESYRINAGQSEIQSDHGKILLTWNSSDPRVATVNKGYVDIGSSGRVYISVRAVGTDVMAEVVEIVAKPTPKPVTGLSLHGTGQIEIGKSVTLVCQVTPLNADNKKIHWVSDDPSIIEVNEYGRITGKCVGTTNIRAISDESEDLSVDLSITVVPTIVKDIHVFYGEKITSGGKNYFEDWRELSQNTGLALCQSVNEPVYLRVSANEDAYNKDLEARYVIFEGEMFKSMKDVTSEFSGVKEGDRIFRIFSNGYCVARLDFQALDEGHRTASYFLQFNQFTGWYESEDGFRSHFTRDVMDVGFSEIDGETYFFNNDGKMQTGWKAIGGKWYYFGTDGVMRTGWKKVGKWYLFGTDGVMRTGWQRSGGKWYYLGTDGTMRTGWRKIGKDWYYFGTDGIMVNGWKKIGKSWYYFKGGVMLSGWQKLGTKWYFFKEGAMKTGWLKSGGKWYYFNRDGEMVTGSRKIGTKTYRFDGSGVCQNP